MQFQVPQFIEVEDKIFGPLTLQQFLYIAGGLGLTYAVYRFLPLLLAIPVCLAVLVFAGLLAFYKVNNKPFMDLVESAFKYTAGKKLYIWKHDWNKKETEPDELPEIHAKQEVNQYSLKTISQSKLKELSWSLDINENLNPLTGEDGRNTK